MHTLTHSNRGIIECVMKNLNAIYSFLAPSIIKLDFFNSKHRKKMQKYTKFRNKNE